MSSKSNMIDPFSPLISRPFLFLIAGGEARRLKAGDAAARKAGEKQRGIVHVALSHFSLGTGRPAGNSAAEPCDGISRSLMNVSETGADHFGDFLAGDEAGHVDNVRAQVAMRTGARHAFDEPPDERHFRAGPNLADNTRERGKIRPNFPARASSYASATAGTRR